LSALTYIFVLCWWDFPSFYCYGQKQVAFPKLIKGTIVHNSNSESSFKIELTNTGECKTEEYLTKCSEVEAMAFIGNKSFAINEVRLFKSDYVSYKYALSYYFYGDLPYSNGEITTPVRIAVLADYSHNVGNIHLKFEDFNSKEDILFKEIKF